MEIMPQKEQVKETEIDVIGLIKLVWHKRKTVLFYTGIFILLGLITALTRPKEYKSGVTLLIETNNSASAFSGLLQQFGGLAGLGLSPRLDREALTPALYPKIVYSDPFLLKLMQQEIFLENKRVSLEEYLLHHTKKPIRQYPIDLLAKTIQLVRKPEVLEFAPNDPSLSGSIYITEEQEKVIKNLKKRISASFDKEDNTLSIGFMLPDRDATAPLTDTIVNMITHYITDYRTSKDRDELEFLERMKKESYSSYLRTQENYAVFLDKNKNLMTEIIKVQLSRLQDEYRLAEQIYSAISLQREEALIKLNKRTPVFKVISPSVIPIKKSKPNRTYILIAYTFLGFFLSLGKIYYDLNIKPGLKS